MVSLLSARSLTAIVACGLLVAGCELLGFSSGPRYVLAVSAGAPFEIEVGQTVVLEGVQARIRFVELPEDGRCPINVDCFWQGQVRASFVLMKHDDMYPITFQGYVEGTDDGPELTIESAGIRVVLKAVAPYPVYDSKTGRSTRGRTATLVVNTK